MDIGLFFAETEGAMYSLEPAPQAEPLPEPE